MKFFAIVYKHLTTRERVAVAGLVLIRLLLVLLDISGLFLVGVVVSLVSGTVISSTSKLSTFLAYLKSIGLENNYIGLATVAVLFFIAKGVLSVLLTYVTARYVASIESSKATQIFRHILESPIHLQESFSRQELLQGVGPAVSSGISQAVTTWTVLAGELTLLLGVSAYLAFTNVILFAEMAAFFALVGLAMGISLGSISRRASSSSYREFLAVQGLVLGSIANFRQLFISPDKRLFIDKFDSSRAKMAHQNATYVTTTVLPRYITEISVMVGVGLLIYQRGAGGGVPATTIAVFLAGLFRIVASMLPIQSGLTQLQRVEAESSVAFKLLDSLNLKPSLEKSNKYQVESPEISIRNLSFSYSKETKPIFDNVNLELPAGCFVAVTGKSGAGKSTLADLLLGLRTPDEGEILIGGHSPRDVGNMGYVPQHPTLFDGTLYENLTLKIGRSRDARHDKRLKELLKRLDLDDYVESLPQGLQTSVGSGGAQLSGGQVQRVGIARALYNEPSLLVLDEATSALDNITESVISDVLNELKGKLSIVVIAHRPETIKAAETTIVIAHGKAILLKQS